jgi:hypothetical protein
VYYSRSRIYSPLSRIYSFSLRIICAAQEHPFPDSLPLLFCFVLWFRLTVRHRSSFSGAHREGWYFLGKIPSSQPSNNTTPYPIITRSRARFLREELQEVLLCTNQPHSNIESLFEPTHFELSDSSALTSLSSESDLPENSNGSSQPTQPLPTFFDNPPIIPAPMSQNPAASVVIPTMPARNHSTAPKFRSDQPRELRRYFDELGHLFGNCQINSDEDKKKYAVRYLEIDLADLWETLPQYQAPYSYDDFVQAIFILYPGASEE